MKKFKDAIDEYTKALNIEPHLAEAYYNRALILLYLKQNEKACKDLSKAGEMGVNDAYNVIKRYCTKMVYVWMHFNKMFFSLTYAKYKYTEKKTML